MAETQTNNTYYAPQRDSKHIKDIRGKIMMAHTWSLGFVCMFALEEL